MKKFLAIILSIFIIGSAFAINPEEDYYDNTWISHSSNEEFNQLAKDRSFIKTYVYDVTGKVFGTFRELNASNLDAGFFTDLEYFLESIAYIEEQDVYACIFSERRDIETGMVLRGYLFLCHFINDSWTFSIWQFY